MKRTSFLPIFATAFGLALQGQGAPVCAIVGSIHGYSSSLPGVPETWTTNIFLSKEGLVSDIRAVPSGTKDGRQGSLRAVYTKDTDGASGSCIIEEIDPYNTGDPVQVRSELKWSLNPDFDIYSLSIHRTFKGQYPSHMYVVTDTSCSLEFGDKEAYWATKYSYDDGPLIFAYRWTYGKQVEVTEIPNNLAMSVLMLDAGGSYRPDLPDWKFRYQKKGAEMSLDFSYRYSGHADPELDWLGPWTWKISGRIPHAKDVLTNVLNYLVLEEWFPGSSLSLFGHSLFAIQLR